MTESAIAWRLYFVAGLVFPEISKEFGFFPNFGN